MVNDKLKKIKNYLSLCIKGHSDHRGTKVVCPWATCKLVKICGSLIPRLCALLAGCVKGV